MRNLPRNRNRMLFLLFFLFQTTSLADVTYNNTSEIMCDGMIFQEVYYEKELLFTNLGWPYNLVLHKHSSRLFFSHTITKGEDVDFEIMACHVDRKDCQSITNVPGGYAIGYDPDSDSLYFGGHDGIYKYDFLTSKAEFYAEDAKSIWAIFVRRNFFYIEYPTQKLYVYQTYKFVPVPSAVDLELFKFYITRRLEVYYANKTALYRIDKSNEFPVMLDDEIIVRQIVEDHYGDVYFCGHNGIYLEDKPYNRLKRVAVIDHSFGMTFDEPERLIYSDRNNIYRLNPSSEAEYCYSKLTANRIVF